METIKTEVKRKFYEKDIQREICDWLFSENYFFWRSNNIPVFDRQRNIFRALPKYTPRGLPDIVVIFEGKFIALEVKIPGFWKYTEDQKKIRDKIIDNGAYYFLVTSLLEAKEVMRGFNNQVLETLPTLPQKI